MDFDTESPSAS